MRRRAHLRLVTSSEVEDTTLTAVLKAEDLAEELGLDPCSRVTCALHRCWLHQCVGPSEAAADRQVLRAYRTSVAATLAR
ncbi:hypothetical protein [Lentzea flaviverrucosa]|uniref:Uncharacterized protein n=1 Tax=Lentzea flaviverrucosa TaxID=200379 RepID=A0A1H9XJ75_9PSEU|nr:hypothetical protein [Lentzea flaviverrucosa]RDI20260.1 hypothetical protein DFR72_115102 [Lentzea flaviverrucosa]SES46250.1 hypothetical protein SAMN05216195_115102 [Lentzea flaviverrucosa]